MQHPAFDEFKLAFRSKQYEQALQLVDQLLQEFPRSGALCWHRASCLERLERFIELPEALELVVQKLPEHLPARLMRVEYSDWYLEQALPLIEGEEDADEDKLPASVVEVRAKRLQKQAELDVRNESDLRLVLANDPQHAQANFLLSHHLRQVESDLISAEEREQEATELLDRAIAAAPQQVDYYLARANHARAKAWVDFDENDTNAELPDHLVRTYNGVCYSREQLQVAAADYRTCWSLSQQPGHALKLATTLHDLAQFDEALAVYDDALAKMPEDAPLRGYFIERRALSENNGAGEREHAANILLSGLDDDGKDQNLADHMAAQAIRGAADAIRRGASVSDAIATHISEDPDTMRAISLARQLLNLVNEPHPELAEVNAKDYPAYQRRHANKTDKAATKAGLQIICDAEAMGMFKMLGKHVLLRFFRDESGEIGIASYAMQHKWPGLLAFVILLLKGKWKTHTMVECVTTFDDGTLISTQPQSISPFSYGDKIISRKLAAGVSVSELVTVHREMVSDYKLQHPNAIARSVTDLVGVEARWIEGQQIKAAYRKSIDYVSDEELHKMLGSHFDHLAPKIRQQIEMMTAT